MWKKITLQIIIVVTFLINAIGQVSSKDLNGSWVTDNLDSSYYKLDTIKLYLDTTNNYRLIPFKLYVEWKKDKGQFDIVEKIAYRPIAVFTKPVIKETIRLKRKKNNQLVEIRRGGKLIELFKILNLNEENWDLNSSVVKTLTLERMKY